MAVRRIFATFCVLLFALAAGAVTLERLSVDEMVSYSTHIVRASVKDSRGVQHGPVVYTEYLLEVTEVLHGNPQESSLRLSLPGGSAGGRQQRFAGVPELSPGRDYLLFLRLGKNGLLQLVGMSQGLFEVEKQAANPVAVRSAIDGILLDRKSGFRVQDHGLRLSIRELRASIAAASARSGGDGR